MNNLDIGKKITIGISTKNRWDDLQISLQRICEFTGNQIEIIILDDASNCECPFDVKKISNKITLRRFENSEGYIVRRNQLASLINTKYYLSFDDDSYPVSGSLEEALRFAEDMKNVFCLVFPIYLPYELTFSNPSQSKSPYQVRSFIGCGHLINTELLMSIGPYEEKLIHQGEEMDIAARAFQKGFFCYHFPSLLVHHLASNSGRNWSRMDFYGARNNVLWNDWYVPRGRMLFKQLRTFISKVLLFIKNRRIGSIKGFIDGMLSLKKYEYRRANMSIENYKNWRKLPHC